MSRFSINPENLKRPIQTFEDASVRLKDYSKQMIAISGDLRGSVSEVASVVVELARRTEDHSTKVENLGFALSDATGTYTKYEQQVISFTGYGSGDSGEGSGGSENGFGDSKNGYDESGSGSSGSESEDTESSQGAGAEEGSSDEEAAEKLPGIEKKTGLKSADMDALTGGSTAGASALHAAGMKAQMKAANERTEKNSRGFINGTKEEPEMSETASESEGSDDSAAETGAEGAGSEQPATGVSSDGFNLLCAYEVPGASVYDANGNLVGLKIMDVGDGKYTLGFGITVDKGDAAAIQYYKDTYGIDVTKVGETIKVDTCRQIYQQKEPYYKSLVDQVCKRNNFAPSQQQYDAMFVAVYNRPALASEGHALDNYLKSGANGQDAFYQSLVDEYKGLGGWSKYGEGWKNRILDEAELFSNGDYKRNH